MMSSSKWKTFTVLSCTRIKDRRQMEKYPVSAFLTPSVTHFSCIRKLLLYKQMQKGGDFPSGLVVKTLPFNARVAGSIPGKGAKILHASWPTNQNIKQKQYCNKFNKDFKKWSTLKKKNQYKNKSTQYSNFTLHAWKWCELPQISASGRAEFSWVCFLSGTWPWRKGTVWLKWEVLHFGTVFDKVVNMAMPSFAS